MKKWEYIHDDWVLYPDLNEALAIRGSDGWEHTSTARAEAEKRYFGEFRRGTYAHP